MGPSGSGKSTLLHILAGLGAAPTSGLGRDRRHAAGHARRSQAAAAEPPAVGFIFQAYDLLAVPTAEQDIALPLRLAGHKPDPAWLEQLIAAVGLRDRRHHRPSELSGGQQQRDAELRAAVGRPPLRGGERDPRHL